MPRRHRSSGPGWFELPVMPFLTIMLGLISVMALAGISLAVQQRDQGKAEVLVALTDIPPGFVPIHVRCNQRGVVWRDDAGTWQTVAFGHGNSPFQTGVGDLKRLVAFLEAKAEANRQLSFSGRQHTIILWIEPEGVVTAYEVQLLLESLGLPLRVGQLPILSQDRIVESP